MRAVASLAALVASTATAGPIALLTEGSTTLALYSAPCDIRSLISNLPYRATWTEGRKTTEACYGLAGEMVVVYFAVDRTVVLIPATAFKLAPRVGDAPRRAM